MIKSIFCFLGDRFIYTGGACYGEVAAWVEMFLLLFGEVVFLRLRVVALGFGSCARASHTPGPSQEGRFVVLLSCW